MAFGRPPKMGCPRANPLCPLDLPPTAREVLPVSSGTPSSITSNHRRTRVKQGSVVVLAVAINGDYVRVRQRGGVLGFAIERSRYVGSSSDTCCASTFKASRRGNRGCSARWTSPIAPEPLGSELSAGFSDASASM
jgi:hypothetical protein